MSRFQSHFKRALMFRVLAPAFTQYPCLAQSSNETAGQPVGAAKGYFSQQLLKFNRQYGFVPSSNTLTSTSRSKTV